MKFNVKNSVVIAGGTLVANILFIPIASAHCPLCTIGAGAAALGALWLGFSSFSIGLFLGAFALAMGLWVGRLIKRKVNLLPHQTMVIGIISFLTTIFPLQPILFDNSAIYISMSGDYGSWLNQTYYIDKYLVGSILGALILLISPHISKAISKARNNKTFPYQGMLITFVSLSIAALTFEFLK